MPKVDYTKDELHAIEQALNSELTSAKRQQKMSKAPEITQVYKIREATLQELLAKTTKYAHGANNGPTAL